MSPRLLLLLCSEDPNHHFGSDHAQTRRNGFGDPGNNLCFPINFLPETGSFVSSSHYSASNFDGLGPDHEMLVAGVSSDSDEVGKLM